MSQSNQISAVLPNADLVAVLGAIDLIKSKLPFLINLSKEDIQALPKMGDKTVSFVNKAIEYAATNPKITPNFLDVPELQKDMVLVTALNSISRQLLPLAESVESTLTLAGSEAYGGSLIFYRSSKDAAKNNVPGASAICEDLSTRFPGKAKATPFVAPK